MPDHHAQFKARLVQALAFDETVAALLGDGNAMHFRHPAQRAAYPAIVYDYDTEYALGPNREGARRIALRLRLVGPDPDALDPLEAAVKALLDEAPHALATENWACRKLRLLRSRMEPAGRSDPEEGMPLFVTVTEWEAWLYAKEGG